MERKVSQVEFEENLPLDDLDKRTPRSRIQFIRRSVIYMDYHIKISNSIFPKGKAAGRVINWSHGSVRSQISFMASCKQRYTDSNVL